LVSKTRNKANKANEANKQNNMEGRKKKKRKNPGTRFGGISKESIIAWTWVKGANDIFDRSAGR